jgi:hypothetical protein
MTIDGGTQAGRWPPKRCDMPDLSNLSGKLTVSYFLNRTLGGSGLAIEGSGQAFFLNLVRLVDKTVIEYEYARQYLQRYVNSNNKTSLLLRCVGHMETCVDTLNRVFLHLRRLRTALCKEQSRTGEALPEIDRRQIPKGPDMDRVRDVRNAVQHMDDRITKGEAGEGKAPIGLMVKSDSIEIANREIYFAELALWIEQVYRATKRLTSYEPSSGD